jgi:alpha-tubulin suppressor-like RCC1 family protein
MLAAAFRSSIGLRVFAAALATTALFSSLSREALAEPLPTTTTLTAAPSPSDVGQSVTMVAIVRAQGAEAPTGSVLFKDGSTDLGSGTLAPIRGESQARIATGGGQSCVVDAGGALKCWGWNDSGQVGNDSTTDVLSPVPVVGLASGVVQVVAGFRHTCALTSAGAVFCWGANPNGELGSDTGGAPSLVPIAVPTLASGVAALAAGDFHTCALTSAGAVRCWGLNEDGQLGDGTLDSRFLPATVSGLTTGATAISAGHRHTCAVVGGGLQCWGLNSAGQLGDGTTDNRSTPTAVSGLASGVKSVAAGISHTCALTTAGAAHCWGVNNAGEIGDGTNDQRLTPTAVSGLGSGVVAISAGNSRSCAVTDTGVLYCWGNNNFGAIGDGTDTQRDLPTEVSGLAGLGMAIATGGTHTCATLTTAGVFCWGSGANGALGNGTTDDQTSPHGIADLFVEAASRATFATTALAAGVRSLLAEYPGDELNEGSSGTISHTVNGGSVSTTTTLTRAPTSSVFGQNVTLTATVTASVGTPTGTVRFERSGTSIGTAHLAGGTASLARSNLPVGTAVLRAVYLGTSGFNGSTSAPVSHVVGKGATNVGLTADPLVVQPGQSTRLRATVSAKAPAAGTPTGTVTFRRSGSVVGTATLAGGVAQILTANTQLGANVFTATFAGNANFTAATSPSVTVEGNPAAGDDTILNSTTGGDQGLPRLAPLASGWVGVWRSRTTATGDFGIVAQRFNASGRRVGTEITVSAPADGTGAPHVATLTNSDFVVVWHAQGDGGRAGGTEIFARRYSSTGRPRGPAFVANNVTAADQENPVAVGLSGGRFAVVWQSPREDRFGLTIIQRLFDQRGEPLGPSEIVNSRVFGDQSLPAITGLNNGDYVVAWTSPLSPGRTFGIFFQRYSSLGRKIGNQVQVERPMSRRPASVAVATLASGGFAVVYERGTPNSALWMQRYSANGQRVGSTRRVKPLWTGVQKQPTAAGLADGGLLVLWTTRDASRLGIEGQRFAASGNPVGPLMRVNTFTTGDQTVPWISPSANGDALLAVWMSAGQDGSGNGIAGKLIAP